MKFALRTSHSSSSDIAALAGRAKEFGYDGLDVPAGIDRKDLGIEIACLSCAVQWSARTGAQAIIEVRKCIDAAVEIGCPMVKISAPTIEGGSVGDAAIGLSDWLGALAERATAVRIVLRNAGSFRTAAAMWKILDRLGNIVGCCLDVDSAAAAGESSAVAVPVLNSRIHLVQVGRMDAAERVVKRLRGIGYGGYISLLAEASEAVLRESIIAMWGWAQRLEVSDAEAAAGVGRKKTPAS